MGASELEIVVISLASASERRRRLAERLRDFPLAWRIFDAHTRPPAGLPYVESECIVRRGRTLREGELAAFGSHYECLREFAEGAGPEYRLVAEDDVFLDPGFPFASLPRLMAAAGIEYLRLHATFIRPCVFIAYLGRYRQLVRFKAPTFGACAYVMSREGARRFVRSVSAIVRPVDDELDRFWHNGLPLYAVYPSPALELYGATTIGELAGVPGLPPARWLRYRLNRGVEWLRRLACNAGLRSRDRRVARAVRELAARQGI